VYEHRRQPLASKRMFRRRLARNAVLALGLIAMSLGIGAVGYHMAEGLPWLDAVLNAAMILTGMGPVDQLHSQAAKLFATCYALFSGVAFLTTMAVLFAPVVHRVAHRFHVEMARDDA